MYQSIRDLFPTRLCSRERLLRTIKGEPTDHIPIVAPVPGELPLMAKRGYTGSSVQRPALGRGSSRRMHETPSWAWDGRASGAGWR